MFFRRQGIEPGHQVSVDSLPPQVKGALVPRDEVAARGSGVAISVVVEPLHQGAGPFFFQDHRVEFIAFFFCEAERALHVEAAAGDEIAGKYFLGKVIYHHFPGEPGAALRQAP